MRHATALDVLIVYNGHLVASPTSSHSTPFNTRLNQSSNLAYAYFLTTCQKLGLSAGLCSSIDITGPGTCSAYWIYSGSTWSRHLTPCRSKQIFDKFSPKDTQTRALRHLLFSHSSVRSYGSYSLFKLFFDKQKSYLALNDYAIPTLTIKGNSLPAISHALVKLKQLINAHKYPRDFTSQLILKDRFGAGGLKIYKFEPGDIQNIYSTIHSNPHTSFILQPLLRFDRGLKYNNRFVASDIRLVYLRGKLISSYLRMAQAGDFRCNQHQGGTLAYISKSDIPPHVLAQATSITKILHQKSSLYTLDFLLSNSGHAYFLEGNTGPGLTWDPTDKIDQQEAKKLIRAIVDDLYHQLKSPLPAPHNLPPKNPVWLPASASLYPALVQ